MLRSYGLVGALPLRLLPNANEVCRELVGGVGGTLDSRDHTSSQLDIFPPRSSQVEPSSNINTTETAVPDLHFTHAESTSAYRRCMLCALPVRVRVVIGHTCYLAAPSGGELSFAQMGVLSPVLPESYHVFGLKSTPSLRVRAC